MKNCEICGKPLNKKGIEKGRTMHYGCRCVQYFTKNGGNTAVNRQKTAIKQLMKEGNLIDKTYKL